MGSLIWRICVGNDTRLTLRKPGSLEFHSTSASAMVAPVPPTLTKVVKKPLAVTYGSGRPCVVAMTLAARNWRKIGATMASSALSPLTPTDQSSVTRKAYPRMPGSVFNAKTSGLNAVCSRSLISTPSTKRISQNTTTRKIIGLSARNDSETTDGTLGGRVMTTWVSLQNFCTRTVISAMRIAVKRPLEPRPSIANVWSLG